MTTDSVFTELNLTRIPPASKLQAWNAADELLLARLADDAEAPRSLLLVNDAFGALAVALGDRVQAWWNDSAMAEAALTVNCRANAVPKPPIVASPRDLSDQYEGIVLQAPKSLALFEWQLAYLAPRLKTGGRLYLLGMVKHLNQGHQKTMARYFRDIQPGRAVKKARCVELREPVVSIHPPASRSYQSPNGLTLVNHPGSYSESSPDPGALAFLQYFKALPAADSVLDLGCGNGILGLSYLRLHPQSQAILVDESAQAVASARDSAQENELDRNVRVIRNHGLSGLNLPPLPLILCNPPFHQQTTLTDDIADALFQQAHDALAPTGEFWVVGNRHLDYHRRLKHWFDEVGVVSRHPKFVVLRCRQPR